MSEAYRDFKLFFSITLDGLYIHKQELLIDNFKYV